MQAMLADIFAVNCGYLDETQWNSAQMSNCAQILKLFVKYNVYLDSKLVIWYIKRNLYCNLKPCEVIHFVDILSYQHPFCGGRVVATD